MLYKNFILQSNYNQSMVDSIIVAILAEIIIDIGCYNYVDCVRFSGQPLHGDIANDAENLLDYLTRVNTQTKIVNLHPYLSKFKENESLYSEYMTIREMLFHELYMLIQQNYAGSKCIFIKTIHISSNSTILNIITTEASHQNDINVHYSKQH